MSKPGVDLAYYALLPERELEDAAYIGEHPDDIGVKGWEFAAPEPLAGRFVAGSEYAMDDRKPPARRKLYSWVRNAMRLPIVSPDLAGILTADGRADFVELLPIRILDRRRKLASADYRIAHVLNQIEAIDLEQSEFVVNELDPECFQSWDKLVLDPERVPEGLQLFTLKWIDKIVFVGEELRERIAGNQSITGVRFVPVGELASWAT